MSWVLDSNACLSNHTFLSTVNLYLFFVFYICHICEENFLVNMKHHKYISKTFSTLLYRYFIASREIYQNVCPEVPGNPRDLLFPDAEGGGKYDNQGFQGTEGQMFWYFSREAMK